jgi:hypothetical protein
MVVAILELVHFFRAVMQKSLYGKIEHQLGFPEDYKHSSMQISFTYILAWTSVLFSSFIVFFTKKLIISSQSKYN